MRRNHRIVFLVGMIFVLGLAACGGTVENFNLNVNVNEENNPINEEEIVFETEESDDDDLNVIAEIDPCLIGSWEVDDDSFIGYLSSQMNTSDDVKFVMEMAEGNFVWSFDAGGEMQMRSDQPMVINVDVIANELKLGTSKVIITARGEARYVNYLGEYLVTGGADYELTGEGSFTLDANQMLTAGASVTLTPGHFSARIEDTGQELNFMDGALDGEARGYTFYTCDAENALLYIEVGLNNPLKFYKIAN